MFFIATIAFDPSDVTREANSDAGQVSETFSSSNILQRFTITMRRAGVTNAVRISHDETVMFDDQSGNVDDLTDALRSFAKNSAHEDKTDFEELRVVLEHEGPLIRSVVDTRIEKTHGADDFAITMTVAGFMKEFAATNGRMPPDQQSLFNQVFSLQTGYDAVTDAASDEFRELVDTLKESGVQHLIVDQTKADWTRHVLRVDGATADSLNGWEQLFDHASVTADDIFYCYQWHQKCSGNQIDMRNCQLVDAQGQGVQHSHEADNPHRNEALSNPFTGLTISLADIPKNSLFGWSHRQCDIWQAVANCSGCSFSKGGFFTRDSMTGRWKEYTIQVEDRTTSSDNGGRNPKLVMRATYNGRFRMIGKLYEETFFGSLGKALFGTQDIDIGNADFDRRFIIKGSKESLEQLFSSPDVRQLVMLQRSIYFSVDHTSVLLKTTATEDPHLMLRLFELMIELLPRLESVNR